MRNESKKDKRAPASAASKLKISAGLDAGSGWTRCVVLTHEDNRLCYLGHGEAPSSGWKNGHILDVGAVSASILSAVQQAEARASSRAGVPVAVDAVVAGIGGMGMLGGPHSVIQPFDGVRPISDLEISAVADRIGQVSLPSDITLLHVFPRNFTVEDRVYRNPRGVEASWLQANVYMLTAPAQEHDNLVKAIHTAHYAVEETVFEPVAAAYACIHEDERRRGVALLDIGLQTADLIVYDGDAVAHAASFRYGGGRFTEDILAVLDLRVGIKIRYDDAERIKIEHGCAMLGETAENSYIEIPSDEDTVRREVQRKFLNSMIESRALDLYDWVRGELRSVGVDGLFGGIVLTGGGSMLNAMDGLAEQALNYDARKGLPGSILDRQQILNWPGLLDNPAWTTATGLAMYSGRLKMTVKRDWRPKAPGLGGMIFATKETRR